jgi:hypothetical protein
MSLTDHIRTCNSFDRARVVPLVADGWRIGWLRHDNAAALAPHRHVFAARSDAVLLVASGDVDRVSDAVDAVVEALVAENRVPKWRNETFDVMARWGDKPICRLDRGAVPFFGTRAYGVHLNGWCREAGTLKLWIGRRAPNKRVSPGKLDNIVAGGIGNGHGILATLYKEAAEEAAIPEHLIDRAVPVGTVSYCMETELGIRDDVLFVYDLELPADFMPRNSDGEIVQFELLEAERVIERVRTSDDFKFNVNLVIIDFALRHGLIAVDDPEYLDVSTGLRRRLE